MRILGTISAAGLLLFAGAAFAHENVTVIRGEMPPFEESAAVQEAEAEDGSIQVYSGQRLWVVDTEAETVQACFLQEGVYVGDRTVHCVENDLYQEESLLVTD